ncbi:toxin co-regulated pilus biosynthesis Q family protein [Achromobacter kerstersii]|uniref:toxin co-regulated pilus biosynthesis Q family protein n=1 Tax=Achromobacter kerstersii TaxID=1353890 RepID=UPI0006C3C08B|nr:Toxin co-regulated pilus biosynthesis protein Q [Achromobacter kerstersii]
MHGTFLATLISVACILSACGFVPPAPPKPADTLRLSINSADPRTVSRGNPHMDLGRARVASTQRLQVPSDMPSLESEQQTVQSPDADASRHIAPPPEHGGAASSPQPLISHTRLTDLTNAPASPPLATVETIETPTADMPTAPAVAEPVRKIWQISPHDGTVRQALARWAADANWTFGVDQWELNFDLPIQASAEFEGESFQEATQALSQAVAMTESPIRPCFYGNRVLRVVPFTRSCNRSPATQS